MEVGRGTILLVEDEEPVRRLIGRILEAAHYEVVAVETAEQARGHFRRDPDEISLLVTDIELAGTSGRELAADLKAVRPSLPVLLMSGQSEAAWKEGAEIGTHYLEKPFSPEVLLQTVRDLIENG